MPKLAERTAPPPAVEERVVKSKGTPPGSVGPPTLSGFCQTAIAAGVNPGVIVLENSPEAQHRLCKGAITNGVGTTWLCRCACHADQLLCHRCGYDHQAEPDNYDPTRRQCADATACANKIAADWELRRKTDPLMIELERCRELGEQERAEKNAEKARRKAEELERERAANPGAADPTPTRPGKVPQRCHEGCGEMTRGGRFMMGHDMRLKGHLFRVARGLDASANETARRRATTEILARGWSIAGIDPTTLQMARAEYAELGEVEAIRQAVEWRYA